MVRARSWLGEMGGGNRIIVCSPIWMNLFDLICSISGFIKDTSGERTSGDDGRDPVQVTDGRSDHPRRSALNQVLRVTLHVVPSCGIRDFLRTACCVMEC